MRVIELCADHGITTDEVTVVVPDVTSMSWPVAQHRLEEERLVAVAAERDQAFLGPEAADFVVVRQNPAAGERVPVDSRIWLTFYRPPGSSGDRAPVSQDSPPYARRGAVDETTGLSVP